MQVHKIDVWPWSKRIQNDWMFNQGPGCIMNEYFRIKLCSSGAGNSPEDESCSADNGRCVVNGRHGTMYV